MNARNKILILMGILLIVSLCWYFISVPRVGDLQLIGTVDANEVILSSRIPGQIQTLTINEGDSVKAGELVATIQSDDYTAWAVPRAAVLNDEQGDHLFQLDHGKAHRVDVQLRQPEGDTVGVLGKLDAKLPVIVQGAYEVDDGSAVRTDDGKAGGDKADDKAGSESKP